MIAAQCLSFLVISGTQSLHIPAQVQDLVKSRIKVQYAKLNSKDSIPEILFDDESCPQKGEYWFDMESIYLNADQEKWRGRLQLPLTELIDGKKIDFSSVCSVNDKNRHEDSQKDLEALYDAREPKAKSYWAPVLAISLLTVGGAYLAYRIYENSQKGPSNPSTPDPDSPRPIPGLGLKLKF